MHSDGNIIFCLLLIQILRVLFHTITTLNTDFNARIYRPVIITLSCNIDMTICKNALYKQHLKIALYANLESYMHKQNDIQRISSVVCSLSCSLSSCSV